jgi:DNA-binding NtrC family response regulator
LTEEALDALRNYSYPGNVREMKSILERIMVECWGREADRKDILNNLETSQLTCDGEDEDRPEPLRGRLAAPSSSGRTTPRNGASLRDEELRLILKTLEECDGNRAETARRLGISSTTLWRRLRAYSQ